MNDIVKRLREHEYNDPANGLGALCGEAADEIVRLRRGGCARDQTTTQFCAVANGLAIENERLRAANQKWLEYSQREIEPELKEQVADLTVECKRLRAALREIVTLWHEEPANMDHAVRRAHALDAAVKAAIND